MKKDLEELMSQLAEMKEQSRPRKKGAEEAKESKPMEVDISTPVPSAASETPGLDNMLEKAAAMQAKIQSLTEEKAGGSDAGSWTQVSQ